jgi:hypothetical protein
MTEHPSKKPDVIFVSYEEPDANENYSRLLSFEPLSKRVHGVKGVVKAWRKAAMMAISSHFFLVEGDNWILDGFAFRWPEPIPSADIYLWTARNAVNKLIWFNGGLKLLSRDAVLSMDKTAVDFFLSMKGQRRIFNQVATETRFNSSPFLAWRCGFRECTKLAGGIVQHPQLFELLDTWQMVGADAPNGVWCILGARMGAEFGAKHHGSAMLRKVNDMDWLKAVFMAVSRSARTLENTTP